MKKLKAYGIGSYSREYGYDLPLLIGYLEDLVSQEGDGLCLLGKGLKWKRHCLVEEALDRLNEAMEMGNEDYSV